MSFDQPRPAPDYLAMLRAAPINRAGCFDCPAKWIGSGIGTRIEAESHAKAHKHMVWLIGEPPRTGCADEGEAIPV